MNNEPMKRKGIILDSLSLLGRNIWGTLAIVILFYIFLTLATIAIIYSGMGISKSVTSTLPAMSIVVVVGTAILAGLVQCFADASVVKYIDERKKGNKIRFIKAIGLAFKRWYRIIGAAIIIGIISGIAGFLVTLINTFIIIYVGSEATMFSVFLGVVIGLVSIILTAFIIPGIMIDDKKLFEAFKFNLGLLFKTDGKVILKLLGLLIVAFIVITLSSLLRVIPEVQMVMIYIIAIIAQIALIFIEVGKVIIYNDFK